MGNITSFPANVPILKQKLSGVFREYKMRTLARNR